MMRRAWGAVDRTLNAVPWYFVLAGGIALGVWGSKKLR
jgi:hypothetical protein